MELTEHIVRYDVWCSKCKHEKVNDINEPCNECLDYPTNTNSKQPMRFEQKD